MKFPKLDFDSSMPLNLQIADIIEQKIINKEIRAGQKIPPQEELRKIFNVALVTVKEALSNLSREGYISRRPRHGTVVISAEPKKNIDFKRKNEICLVICTGSIRKTIGSPSFYEIISGVEEKIKEKNLNLLYKTMNGYDGELNFHEKAKDIAGLVVAGNITRKHMRMIKKTRMPYVRIGDIFNEKPENEKVDVICADDYRQTYLAARHLIALGHRKILFFTTRLSKMFPFDKEGLNGYLKALKDAGLPRGKDLQVETGNTIDPEAGYSAMKEFLESHENGFTGLICTNSDLYTGILKAFSEKNIRVPEDVSVVSIDYSSDVTSIIQDQRRFGIAAVERLIQRLTNPGWKPERVVIQSKIHIGESTRQIKDSELVSK